MKNLFWPLFISSFILLCILQIRTHGILPALFTAAYVVGCIVVHNKLTGEENHLKRTVLLFACFPEAAYAVRLLSVLFD